MAEFSIVHLSDLHIKGDSLSPTLQNLIKDIEKRTRDMKSIILVITGDIIHQGQYKKNPDNIYGLNKVAIQFFEKLNTSLNNDVIKNDKVGNQWISKRVIDIQIIAGNHDKDMSSFNPGDNIYKDLKNFPNSKDEWNAEKPKFAEFINFVNAIYKIFGIKKSIQRNRRENHYACTLVDDDKKETETFGVDFVDVTCLTELTDLHNGKLNNEDLNSCCNRCKAIRFDDVIPELTVAFIRLNTAIVSFGGKDNDELHNLSLGEYQINSIIKKYQSERNKFTKDDTISNDIITIVLAHHPTSFLKPIEEDKFKVKLLDKNQLNANFYICGHTHDRSLTTLSKADLKVTTLATGIGWDDETGWNNEIHSYSIYTFNEEKNNMSTKMFRTDHDGNFIDDYFYYTERQRRLKRISSPYRIIDYPTIEISRTGDAINELIVDDSILKVIKTLYETKHAFNKRSDNLIRDITLRSYTEFINKNKNDEDKLIKELLEFIENYEIPTDGDKTYAHFLFSPSIDNYLKKYAIKVITREDNDYPYEQFFYFLNELASIFGSLFQKVFSDDIVRFRVCRHGYYNDKVRNRLVDCYVPFIEYPLQISTKTIDRHYSWKNGDDNAITAVAYKEDTPRIYTLNKELVEFRVENWLNFIVIAPHTFRFEPNIGKGSEEEFPAISFVFSVRLDTEVIKGKNLKVVKEMFKNLSNKLYLMEYININATLKSIINYFSEFYKIDPVDFIEYIEKKTNSKL